MDRSDFAATTQSRGLLQLKYICPLLCLIALCPMLGYFYEHFRVVHWPIDASGYPVGRDFVNLWSAGRAALSGDYSALFDAKKYALDLQRLFDPSIVENGLVWSYPPTAFWLGLPFAKLPFYSALPLWTISGLVVNLWAYRLHGSSTPPLWPLPWLILAPGILLVLLFAQTGLVTTALFIGGLLLARDRPLVAGALLAGFVVKPHMGLALPFVLMALRYWRAFAATAAFSALYLLLTVLAFGLEPWDLYLSVTVPKHLGLLTPWGLRLPWMFIGQYFPMLATGLPPDIAMWLHWLLAGLALASLLWTLPRLHDRNLQLIVAAAATLLVSPYMLFYEQALVAVAALRAAAYAPPAGQDPYATTRWLIVIVALLSPVIGLLTVAFTGINPVSGLMLAIVVGATVCVRSTAIERQAWRGAGLRSRLLSLPALIRQS